MNYKRIAKAVKNGIKRAAPAISIGVGVCLTATSAYKVAKAIPAAKQHIIEKEVELGVNKLTLKQTVQACGKDFVEPAIIGAAGLSAVTAGVVDYEHSIKNLGSAVGAASMLLNEQTKEMQKTLGTAKTEEIKKASIDNVAKSQASGFGARIPTPGGNDIFIDDLTGREYLSSEEWIRECFSSFMDIFVDNPDDRPKINDFYDMLAPSVKKSSIPIGNCLTFPYDRSKQTSYNRVSIYFEPAETVDGKAAFTWKYSHPLEYCHDY